MDTELKMSRAKTKLLQDYPFWGTLALTLQWKPADWLPTMGTDGKSVWYNKDFVDALPEDQLLFVVVHEVCHVALKHSLRMGDRHSKKWNYAADFAINDMLIQEGLTFAEGGLHDKQYRDMSSEAIYSVLPGVTQEENDQTYGGEEEHILRPCDENGNPLSEDELKEMGINADRMLKVAAEVAKQHGKLPAGMKDIIDELLEPKIDWRDKIRRTVLGETPEDFTYRRPNRRHLESSGVYLPTIHKVSPPNVYIGLDTSGSVSMQELQAFLSEIQSIQQDCKPEKIFIAEIDTILHNVKEFGPDDDLAGYEVEGRGGTEMQPFFDFLNENMHEENPTVILFSDMYFDWDNMPEPDYPVLFVSSGHKHHEWGDLVKLELD